MARIIIGKNSTTFIVSIIIAMGVFTAISMELTDVVDSTAVDTRATSNNVETGIGSKFEVVTDTWDKHIGKIDYDVPFVDELSNKFEGLTNGASRIKNGLTQIGDWTSELTNSFTKMREAGKVIPFFNQFIVGFGVMLTIITIRSFDFSI